MKFLVGLILLLCFLVAYVWLYASALAFFGRPARRQRWGQGRVLLASFFIAFYGAALVADAVRRVPWVHLHSDAEGWMLLGRFDTTHLWASLAGLLMAEGIPWIVLAVVLVVPTWLYAAEDSVGQWVIPTGWLALRGGYYLLAKALTLPPPTTASFPDFYSAVCLRVGPVPIEVWLARLQATGGFLALLAVFAVILHGGAGVRRRTALEYPADDLSPYLSEPRQISKTALFYLLVVSALWIAVAVWDLPLRDRPDLFFVRKVLLRPTLLLATTVAVTMAFVRFSGPFDLFESLKGARSRLQDLFLGLLWSIFLVCGVTVAGRFLGWWGWPGAHPFIGRTLAAILIPLLLEVAAAEIAFRGYLLQKLNTVFPFFLAALAASLLPALLVLGAPGLTWIGWLATFLAGLFSCSLYRLSRSLWLPIAFRFGWNGALGLCFGFPESGSGGLLLGFLDKKGTTAWEAGGAFGPRGNLLMVAALLLAFWTLRGFTLTPPDRR